LLNGVVSGNPAEYFTRKQNKDKDGSTIYFPFKSSVRNGTPLNTEVESTSTDEGHVAEKTVDGIKIKKQDKHHRKATRLVPVRVISDKDYDDDGLRETFAEKGIELIVPYRNNRVNRSYEDKRKLRRYCRRYKVERTNAWFKNCHRGAVRWDRCLTLYKGFSNSPVFVLL